MPAIDFAAKKGVRRRRRASNKRAGFNYFPDTGDAYFEVYEPGTRLKRRLTLHDVASKEEAEKLWDAFRAKVKRRVRRVRMIAPTLREFIDEYFGDIRAQVRDHTADSYDYTIRTHLLPEFGELRLTEISAGAVNRWSASLMTAGYSGATINAYVNTVRLILGYALKWDVIDEMPIKKQLDKYKVNLPCNELSLDEERRFLAAFDDEQAFRRWIANHRPAGEARVAASDEKRFGGKRRYGAGIRADSDAAGMYYRRFRDAKSLFVGAVETGLRRSDLLRLKWSQVSFSDNTIEIITGKTQKKAFIPISKRCKVALRECRDRAENVAYVFVDYNGQPLAEKTVIRYFGIAKELAGFEDRPFRFHDLRHTYGSKLAREGVNIEYIAATMAHSSTRMTQRYARPGDTALERVAQALDRAADRQGGVKRR